MKRWRPKLHKWKTIDDISTNSPIISRHQPPLTLPQLRRYNLGGKDDLNSSLGGTFNNYLRPSTKRTSKIVKNEAYIVEARKKHLEIFTIPRKNAFTWCCYETIKI